MKSLKSILSFFALAFVVATVVSFVFLHLLILSGYEPFVEQGLKDLDKPLSKDIRFSIVLAIIFTACEYFWRIRKHKNKANVDE